MNQDDTNDDEPTLDMRRSEIPPAFAELEVWDPRQDDDTWEGGT